MAFERVLRPQSVNRAIAEFNRRGEDAFLSRYGFGPARRWCISVNGKLYPSKAIYGVAYQYEATGNRPLTSSDFTQGEGTVRRRLTNLGFELVDTNQALSTATSDRSGTRNPNWQSEELILALDLYIRHRTALPQKDSKEVSDLSRTLNQLAAALGLVAGDARFRNEASVYMKLMNFLAIDPTYKGAGLSQGGEADKRVWSEFSSDAEALAHAAAIIRRTISMADELPLPPADDDEEFSEGRLAKRVHTARERNPRLVRRKKEQATRRFGRLQCEVCDFDFANTYGELGHGFIECHHLIAVADWPDGVTTTRLEDTALVCSNCHRMLHRRRPWPLISELRAAVQKA